MSERLIGILLAEDTEDMRFLLDAAFAGSRFEIVAVATTGEEALALFDEQRASIGAVALDQRMPGMDGLSVARHIRDVDPDIPIVLFSAELGRELQARAAALDIGVLHKDQILLLPDHPAFG